MFKVIAVFLCCVVVFDQVCGVPAFTKTKAVAKSDNKQSDRKRHSPQALKDDIDRFRNVVNSAMIRPGSRDMSNLADVIMREIKRRRLERCVKQFGSYSICENRLAFYIWAQTKAKDIMTGQD